MSNSPGRWLITCSAGAIPPDQTYATKGAASDVIRLHSAGCPGEHDVPPQLVGELDPGAGTPDVEALRRRYEAHRAEIPPGPLGEVYCCHSCELAGELLAALDRLDGAVHRLIAGLDTRGIRPFADNPSATSWVLFCLDGIDKLQRAAAGQAKVCTGATALWCPTHGVCRCPNPREALDAPDCPLHHAGSAHPDSDEATEMQQVGAAQGSEDALERATYAIHSIIYPGHYTEKMWADPGVRAYSRALAEAAVAAHNQPDKRKDPT